MMVRRSDEQLPAPLPAAAHAAVSPSGLVLAGAGTALGIVAGLPLAAAVVIGAGCWGVRVAVASARAAGRRRRAKRPETIDPYAVPDPWRRFVRESLTAQTRFNQAVARCEPGPLRDRLDEVARRIDDGVRECWRVAHLGAALDAALAGIDPEGTSGDLRRFQDQARARSGQAHRTADGNGEDHVERGDQTGPADQTEAALAARLQAGRRIQAAAQRTTDRLVVLTADLNAAVASAVELSLDASDPAQAVKLYGSVESVVGEIESLRRALEETAGTTEPRPAGPATH